MRRKVRGVQSTVTIKQGDEYMVGIRLTLNGESLTSEDVSLVEFMLDNTRMLYPEDVSYGNGIFHYPLTQGMTFGLTPGEKHMDIRVMFKNGDIRGIRSKVMLNIEGSDSTIELGTSE